MTEPGQNDREGASLEKTGLSCQEAARRNTEFLATLAHELRNPLGAIGNGLQLMGLAGVDGPVEQARAMMQRQLGVLVRLVDDLLDVNRMSTGKLELRREPVALRSVVDAALETTRALLQAQGHDDVLVDAPDVPVVVHGDPMRLTQVVSNLLANAAKYTPRGGHIRVSVRGDGTTAELAVNDDGIGIPADMLETVFDMFSQVDRTLEKSSGGLGIGLSLVKGLVELHGGTVQARSEGEGRGSEIRLCLPIALPHASTAQADAADAPEPGSGCVCGLHGIPAPAKDRKLVLVVDDSAVNQMVADSLLSALGYDVQLANDGIEALAACQRAPPDVVLMDIEMPLMGGLAATERLRDCQREGSLPPFPIVGATSGSDRYPKSVCLEAGMDGYLSKPLDPQLLEDELQRVLPAARPARHDE